MDKHYRRITTSIRRFRIKSRHAINYLLYHMVNPSLFDLRYDRTPNKKIVNKHAECELSKLNSFQSVQLYPQYE
ncbi:hypothetical protein GCM10025776_20050 [Corallincola platygyrae]